MVFLLDCIILYIRNIYQTSQAQEPYSFDLNSLYNQDSKYLK